MAAITDIPAPPAIVASASANKPAQSEGDNDFATELAAAKGDTQQKNDAPAQQAKPSEAKAAPETMPKDAPQATSVPSEAIQIAEALTPDTIEPQDLPLNKAPAEAAPEAPKPVEAKKEEAPQDIALLPQAPLPVAQPATPSAGNTNKEEKTDETKGDSRENKEQRQVQADANTMAPPVAAPVGDVSLPATLPLPVAQSGEAPKAEPTSAATIDGLDQELRPSIEGVKPEAAKPQEQAAAKPDGEQIQTPAQPAKADGKGDERNGGKDADARSREPQIAAANDKPAAQPIDTPVEAKPVAAEAPAQASQPHASASQSANNPPSVAAAQPINQPQAASPGSFASAVSFHGAHEARPAADQLAVAINTHSKDGAQSFEIRLDPPELGRVEVKMIVDDAGKTQASVVVERPHTLELLQRDAHNLERALKESGLDLTGNGLNFSLKGQDRQAQQEQNAPFVRAKILNMELTAAETAQAHINAMLPSGSARLDIRV